MQVLTSDSTPCVDSACYRRHHPQQFGWRLEALRRVFPKEHLKQNNDWLRDILKLVER